MTMTTIIMMNATSLLIIIQLSWLRLGGGGVGGLSYENNENACPIA